MEKLFSEHNIRAVVVLVPLLIIVILVAIFARPKADPEAARRVERAMERPTDSVHMRHFDPNTADFEELRALGLSKYEAAGLLRYRASGKVFRIPEDMALCYQIGDSTYTRIAPYIRIGRRFAIAPDEYRRGRIIADKMAPAPFRIDTVTVRYLQAIGAFSKRQAESVIRWRDRSGFHDMEEFRACYIVGDSVAAALEPYIIFPEFEASPYEEPLELNTADSAALLRVHGIGERTAGAIVRYRERLGGFVRMEQLSEVRGVTEGNYERILKQIYCDSCKIRKIDVNFALPNVLGAHPYIAPHTLRKLLKERQLKGGWSTTEELVENKILTKEEAARLAPYMVFGSKSSPGNE